MRSKITGTPERPRLSVFRSCKHTYVQLIDDLSGNTLVSVCTLSSDIKSEIPSGGNKKAAEVVGKRLAEKAKEKGIEKVAFDRGHYRYHGRVAALAKAAREAGLSF